MHDRAAVMPERRLPWVLAMLLLLGVSLVAGQAAVPGAGPLDHDAEPLSVLPT